MAPNVLDMFGAAPGAKRSIVDINTPATPFPTWYKSLVPLPIQSLVHIGVVHAKSRSSHDHTR